MSWSERNIVESYYQNKEYLLKLCKERLDRRMFDTAMVEVFLDDIFIKVVRLLPPFKSETDFLKYMAAAIKDNSRVAYFKRRKEMLAECEMSPQEMKKQLDLARSIIDDARNN